MSRKTKIAIITQPLRNNYGGILQAFALQTILIKHGYLVNTDNRHEKRNKINDFFILPLKKIVLKYFFKRNVGKIFPQYNTKINDEIGTNDFLKKHMNTFDLFQGRKTPLAKKIEQFDAFIVGSDQVWRPKYSPRISNYFFDFLVKYPNMKKIAYAASFGVDDWEFDENDTKKCKSLIKYFNRISVREDTGIILCQNYFDITPELTLDPTLLLNKKAYCELIESLQNPFKDKTIVAYILDKNQAKFNIIKSFAAKHKMQYKIIYANEPTVKKINIIEWLNHFKHAYYIITDSYHGLLFSIIFEKNFYVFANNSRGVSRMSSILKLLGLENRLINENTKHVNINNDTIDYEKTLRLLSYARNKSINFLISALDDH